LAVHRVKKQIGGELASRKCSQCHSKRICKDGLRETREGLVQRFLCHKCGYRFSTSVVLSVNRQNSRSRQVCVTLQGAKNLASATETKTVAGDELSEEAKGLVTQFMAWLEKEGYPKETQYPSNLKTMARLGANLLDPESVKEVLGRHKVKSGTKMQYMHAYSLFAKMLRISWEPPRYRQEETLPFIPDEKELDAIIAGCRSRRMAAYLQCLKETFADPGEVLGLKWIDVSGNIITINRPVKGHLPRQIPVSNRLIAMMDVLPKESERIFPITYRNLFSCYTKVRGRVAEMQKNERIRKIQLRTFRHWGATWMAHYTNGNVLKVKQRLGHKRVENTMKYIGMVTIRDDEFEVATATNVEEAKKILEAGYTYSTEMNGVKLFTRPKRFSPYVY
jgi:integrase